MACGSPPRPQDSAGQRTPQTHRGSKIPPGATATFRGSHSHNRKRPVPSPRPVSGDGWAIADRWNAAGEKKSPLLAPPASIRAIPDSLNSNRREETQLRRRALSQRGPETPAPDTCAPLQGLNLPCRGPLRGLPSRPLWRCRPWFGFSGPAADNAVVGAACAALTAVGCGAQQPCSPCRLLRCLGRALACQQATCSLTPPVSLSPPPMTLPASLYPAYRNHALGRVRVSTDETWRRRGGPNPRPGPGPSVDRGAARGGSTREDRRRTAACLAGGPTPRGHGAGNDTRLAG